ncbi:MAG TPA: hypothetical protein DIU00_24305 [Phycisphaerales bacterium]|nr:hypothetical protein [Phycisphaerales bacterium]
MSLLAKSPKGQTDKALTLSELIDFVKCFAIFLQKNPDLAQLMQAWPEFSEQTKAAIKALVQSHKTEGE